MKQSDLYFWLDEQEPENGWRVSLPCCPICEPGLQEISFDAGRLRAASVLGNQALLKSVLPP